MKKWLLFLLLWVSGCGNANLPTGSQPYLASIIPNPASPGDLIEVHGVGFSPSAGLNFILFGENASPGLQYSLNSPEASDDVEILQFEIPTDTLPDTYDLIVWSDGKTSNSILFTVSP